MTAPSPRQQVVLEYVRDFIDVKGYARTVRDVAKYLHCANDGGAVPGGARAARRNRARPQNSTRHILAYKCTHC